MDYDPGLWYGAFAASATSIVYRPRNVSTETQTLAWFDVRGNKIGVTSNPGVFRGVSLAPDGKTIATLCGDPDTNVCLIHADGTVTQIDRGGISGALAWAPDSSAVAYAKHQGPNRFEVSLKPLDNALSERTILNNSKDSWPMAWLPKSTELLLARTLDGGRCEAVVMNISSGAIQQFLPASDGLFHSASFSPDGKWVAYDKGVDGRYELYIASFPNPSVSYRITKEGGSSPKWRSDGRVYFLGADEKLYSVAVTQTNGALKFGDPRSLFHPPILSAPWDRNSFDISRDGTRVLVNSSSSSNPSELVLLTER